MRGVPGKMVIRELAFVYEDEKSSLSLPRIEAELVNGTWRADLKSLGLTKVSGISAKIENLHAEGHLDRLELAAMTTSGAAALRDIRVAGQPVLSAQTVFVDNWLERI